MDNLCESTYKLLKCKLYLVVMIEINAAMVSFRSTLVWSIDCLLPSSQPPPPSPPPTPPSPPTHTQFTVNRFWKFYSSYYPKWQKGTVPPRVTKTKFHTLYIFLKWFGLSSLGFVPVMFLTNLWLWGLTICVNNVSGIINYEVNQNT